MEMDKDKLDKILHWHLWDRLGNYDGYDTLLDSLSKEILKAQEQGQCWECVHCEIIPYETEICNAQKQQSCYTVAGCSKFERMTNGN